MVKNLIASQKVAIVNNFSITCTYIWESIKYLEINFPAATAIYLNRLWTQNSEFNSKSQVPQRAEKDEATENFFKYVEDVS